MEPTNDGDSPRAPIRWELVRSWAIQSNDSGNLIVGDPNFFKEAPEVVKQLQVVIKELGRLADWTIQHGDAIDRRYAGPLREAVNKALATPPSPAPGDPDNFGVEFTLGDTFPPYRLLEMLMSGSAYAQCCCISDLLTDTRACLRGLAKLLHYLACLSGAQVDATTCNFGYRMIGRFLALTVHKT